MAEGVSRTRSKIDVWMKDLGTEKDLIKKWKSGKIMWKEFEIEYMKSLNGKESLLRELADNDKSTKGNVTLLCTDKELGRCHRSILADEKSLSETQ